jgi:outer membrane protein assembly factor BamB/tetratricopeptide (TPR) repeat protein
MRQSQDIFFRPVRRRRKHTSLFAALLALVFGVYPIIVNRTQGLVINVAGGANDVVAPGDNGATTFSRVQVDDSFAARDLLRTAAHLVQSGHLDDAIRTYQSAADQYANKVIQSSDGSYISVQEAVWRTLLQIPDVQHGLYDRIYGLAASRAIAQARQSGSQTALSVACELYFPSSAAAGALEDIAAGQFENGDFAAAAQTWLSLMNHPAEQSAQPMLLDHAALAAWLAGEKDLSLDLQQELAANFPNVQGLIDGQMVNYVEHLKTVLVPTPWAAPQFDPSSWPAFNGNFSRNRAADASAIPGAVMWSRPLDTLAAPGFPALSPDNNNWQQRMQQVVSVFNQSSDNDQGNSQIPPILFSYPTCSGDVLYLNQIDHIEALDIASGYTLWQYPALGSHEPQQTLDNITALAEQLDHYSCTLEGDRLYSVIIKHAANNTQQQRWPMYGSFSNLPDVSVVCLDNSTGNQRWTVDAQTLESANGAIIWPACSPMVANGSVYLVVAEVQINTGQTQLFLVRLDADTGRLQWNRFLCSVSGPVYGYSPLDLVPAMADGMIYISTGQGADLAVHADTGNIAWIRLTPTSGVPIANGGYGQGQRLLPWKINPPIVYNDLLITSEITVESAAHIYVYDRWTGRVIHAFQCANLDNGFLTVGAVDNHLLTVGDKLDAVNLQTGRIDWQSRDIGDAGELSARPFLTAQNVYLPLSSGLLLINAHNGTFTQQFHWPDDQLHLAGAPGNLLVTAHQLVVVNDHSVVGYAKWSDALAYLQSRIAAAPGEPEPYLVLAEVAFGSRHIDMSQSMMQKAVDLCSDTTAGAMRDRVFDTSMRFGSLLAADPAQLTAAMFYFRLASEIAATPAQQVLWRSAMADLELSLKNHDAALALLEQILCDPTLRQAPLEQGQSILLAGPSAENSIAQDIIGVWGRDAYASFENSAAALLARASEPGTSPDDRISLYWKIVNGYPNSIAALSAGRQLAAELQTAQDWPKSFEILLWLSERDTDATKKLWVEALLARTLAGLGHWNQALILAQRGLQNNPKFSWDTLQGRTDFQTLQNWILSAAPAGSLAQLARLDFSLSKSPILFPSDSGTTGTLLTPVESDPAFNRFDHFLVCRSQNNSCQVLRFNADPAAAQWTADIPDARQVLLLGSTQDADFILTGQSVVALSAKDGSRLWVSSLDAVTAGVQPVYQLPAYMFTANLADNMPQQQVVVVGGGPVLEDLQDQNGQPDALSNQQVLAQDRMWRFGHELGPTSFRLLQLFPGSLLAIGGSKAMLIDTANGENIWTVPLSDPGLATASSVCRSGNTLAIAIDAPFSKVLLIDAASGRLIGKIALQVQDQCLWMQSGPAGMLYISGIHAVLAYDPSRSLDAPVWVRRDVIDSFPTATQLTLDGLIAPTDHGLRCLDQASGRTLWEQATLPGDDVSAGIPTLRTGLNGETIVVMTPSNLLAYLTRTGEMSWKADFVPQQTPPLASMNLGDPDLALVASGPMENLPNVMVLYLIDQADQQGRLDNGSIVLSQRLVRSAADPSGPPINHWMLADTGVIFEVDNTVYFYHE